MKITDNQITGGGRQVSMFHGHSVADENNKKNLLRYFQQVDKGLMDLLEACKRFGQVGDQAK